jgi:hypothetical protein
MKRPISIEFEHVKGHSNDRWNDHVDRLANEGCAGNCCSVGRYAPSSTPTPHILYSSTSFPASSSSFFPTTSLPNSISVCSKDFVDLSQNDCGDYFDFFSPKKQKR